MNRELNSNTRKKKAGTVSGERSRDAIGYGTVCGRVSKVGRRTFTLKPIGKGYKFLLPTNGPKPEVDKVVCVSFRTSSGVIGLADPVRATSVDRLVRGLPAGTSVEGLRQK